MKKLISILMSTVIIMTTFIFLSAGNVAGAAMPPEIYLLAPYQHYIAGEEITFDLKIPVDVVKDIIYAKLFIDCNTDVLKFKNADYTTGELSVTETDKGYTFEFYPCLDETNAATFRATLTFTVAEGDIDVNAHALLQYRDSDTAREARLADDLPNNTVFQSDEVPRLMITGDLEIFRKGDTIYLPYSITKNELKGKIRSTHNEYPVDYKVMYHTETEYALTGDELFVTFDGRQGEKVRICILGDADYNGIVNAADARKTLRYSAKLEPFPEKFSNGCDFNGNCIADASDARKLLRISAKLDHFEPVEVRVSKDSPYKFGTLMSLSDAGYLWRCTASDETAFEITEEHKPSVDNTGKPPEEIIVGDSVLQTFTLLPKKTGVYEIHFEHARPWNNELLEEFSFVLVVE